MGCRTSLPIALKAVWEFRCLLHTGSVALHCKVSATHCPHAVWQ